MGIEIRPIRQDETESFLLLLCEVFGIDAERVRGIFYQEPFFDLSRKWALFESGEMVSVLTTVPLIFGWGQASGIAGVGSRESVRGLGYASKLIQEVLRVGAERGETAAFLFAKDPRVYESIGFSILDEVIQGPLDYDADVKPQRLLSLEESQEIYNSWAEQDPNRLRRDGQRWSYWTWNLRFCTAFSDGYICQEGAIIREAVMSQPLSPWPMSEACEWSGLKSVAELLEVPMLRSTFSTHFMGFGVDVAPVMFQTDQF